MAGESFVSEAINPDGGAFDSQAMARGEPGLPTAFRWRDRSYAITEVIQRWNHCSREGAHAQGDLYLRRHYFKLRMSDGTIWTVYFLRQPPRGRPRARAPRWFLETLAAPDRSPKQ